MSTKLLKLKESFISKQEQLENARTILKKEFFGIDKAIDELVNNTRSWFVLNEFQNRPLIVNLWGLTGVGKTSLVTRLAELLHYDNLMFKFDLGDKSGSNSFRNGIEELCEKEETEPLIIVLDEFQHSRTIKGPLKQEIENDKNRKVWELIDSGKIEYYEWQHGVYDLIEYVNKLKHLLKNGVVVKNGLIIDGMRLYKSEINHDRDWRTKEDKLFVNKSYYSKILDFVGRELKFNLLNDVKKHILKLDGNDSVSFLLQVIKIAKKPKIKNFSKSLIFIIGNLDEAYTMSDNLTTDLQADDFYESSLKISIPQIKSALATRFRNEQVARLGNIHIIYPALNKAAYESIIRSELHKVVEKTKSHLDIKITFDDSVMHLIYKEGVFPTQGVRPLLTTINCLIKNNLSLFFGEVLIQDLRVSNIIFSIERKELICDYVFNKKLLHKKKVAILTPLEDIRVSKKDDPQAITAVHESGHAIISAILLKVVPEQVFSVTTEQDSNGFIYTKFPWDYVSKKEIINRVALFLGGHAAEELIFGNDHITSGSSSDIYMATRFLTTMYKENGMGETPILYNIDTEKNNSYHNCQPIEEIIKNTIEKGYDLAKITLKKEMKLLLKMSDYLSDHSYLEKEALTKMVNNYKISDIEIINKGDLLFYRNHLKNLVVKKPALLKNNTFGVISLNHKKE